MLKFIRAVKVTFASGVREIQVFEDDNGAVYFGANNLLALEDSKYKFFLEVPAYQDLVRDGTVSVQAVEAIGSKQWSAGAPRMATALYAVNRERLGDFYRHVFGCEVPMYVWALHRPLPTLEELEAKRAAQAQAGQAAEAARLDVVKMDKATIDAIMTKLIAVERTQQAILKEIEALRNDGRPSPTPDGDKGPQGQPDMMEDPLCGLLNRLGINPRRAIVIRH